MRITAKEAVKHRWVKSFILAGGRGERLKSIPEPSVNKNAIAKPAVPVGPMRAIDFSFRSLVSLGFQDVTVCTAHLDDIIRDTNAPDILRGLKADCLSENPYMPKHTVGAIRSAIRRKENDLSCGMILILNGDVVHDIDFEPIIDEHLRQEADLTVVTNPLPPDSFSHSASLRFVDMPNPKSYASDKEYREALGQWITKHQFSAHKIAKMGDRDFPGKMRSGLSLSSFYIVNSALFKKIQPFIPDFYDDMEFWPEPSLPGFGAIFNWLTTSSEGRRYKFFGYILGLEVYRRDIGTPQSLLQANLDILDGRIDVGISIFRQEAQDPSERIYRGPNTYIDPSAQIIGPVMIARDVIIGPGARIEHSVIREGNHIEAGAEITESVLFPEHPSSGVKNHIGKNARLRRSLYTGGNIEEGATFDDAIIYPPVGGCAFDSF